MDKFGGIPVGEDKFGGVAVADEEEEQEFTPTLSLSEVGRKPESYMVEEPPSGFLTTPVSGPTKVVRHPQTAVEGLYNVAAKAMGQMITPLAAATAPLTTVGAARPLIAGVMAGLGAKGAGQIAGEQLAGPTIAGFIPTPTQGLTPGQRVEGVGDLAVNLTMAAGAPLTALAVKGITTPAEVITNAAYRDAEGHIFTGANHPEILEKLGVKGFESAESRNTPQFGFMTDKGRFITREQAGPVSKASGQNLKEFEPGEPVHSDEVASPVEPDKALGDVPQPEPSQVRKDVARYQELEAKTRKFSQRGVAPPPSIDAEIQEIKNRYGGYVPKLSEGPGAASPGDTPASPPQAIAAGAQVEQATPENRPLGAVSAFTLAFDKMRNSLSTALKGLAGESMPKTTAVNNELGEAGVRYASSRVAAEPLANTFSAKALAGTEVDPVKLGAALTEDNLRSIRESLRQKATELRAKGDLEGSDAAAQKADQVTTVIGSKGSPFQTEDEYFDFLEQPDTKQAIKQHIQLWQEIIDPQYRQAASIDPEVELPTRGQQTGARINLKAVLPEETAIPVKGVGAPSLTATFKRKTPFAIKAKGTGQSYDIDYSNIIANTFERQLEIANKNQFDKMLVESGNAVIDAPGQQVTVHGERGVPFPLERKLIVSGGRAFPKGQNIYVRESLAQEYRSASNVDPRWNIPFVTKVLNTLNRAALAGLTDATVHFSNQMTALFNRPVSGRLFFDTLLSATGRADIPVTLVKTVVKAFNKNQEQLAQLAEIGAMRPKAGQPRYMGRFLKATDELTRTMLDDTFNSLVEDGIVKDTETARREYVNQIGQYNRRLQGPMTRFFRETGFGPFITAGKTFNALGVKMVALAPGAEATSGLAEMALRANVLSKWVGAAVAIGTLNYLLTKDKGGGVMGRPGTPIGNVDFGANDSSGKQLSLPLLSIMGLGRGLRVTGVKGAIDSKRLGLTDTDMLDTASRDIINSWVSPAAGPPIRFGFVGASGFPPAVSVGRASRVAAPGESQRLANLKEAMLEANPVVQSYVKYRQGKPVHEVLSSQLPRFTLSPGKTPEMVEKYPKIVSMAQGNAFIEDAIFQARRMPKGERRAFLKEQFKRLPKEQVDHAWNEANRRRVFK